MKQRLLSLLLAFVMCFGIVACGGANTEKQWQESYDLGIKYLSEGNYEEAIIQFTAAIQIDPKRPDAYISLADVYVAQGDYDAALAILQQGIDATGDETLRHKWSELDASALRRLPQQLRGDFHYEERYYRTPEEMEQFIPYQTIAAGLAGDCAQTRDAAASDPGVQEAMRASVAQNAIQRYWTILEDGALLLVNCEEPRVYSNYSETDEVCRYFVVYRQENGTAFHACFRFRSESAENAVLEPVIWMHYSRGASAGYLYNGSFTRYIVNTVEFQGRCGVGTAQNDMLHGELKEYRVEDESKYALYYFENGVPVPHYPDEGGTLWAGVDYERGTYPKDYNGSTNEYVIRVS